MKDEITSLEAIIKEAEVSRHTLNKIVLNYLLFEGYKETAIKFANEVGIELTRETEENSYLLGLKSIDKRNEIKSLILDGELESAINKVNLWYPDLLETNEYLYFKLLLLSLIEMIRGSIGSAAPQGGAQGNAQGSAQEASSAGQREEFIMQVIDFTKEKLTNKAIKNKLFMEELELIMTLLLYSNLDGDCDYEIPKKLSYLLELKLRREISDLVNKAVLIKETSKLSGFYNKRLVNVVDEHLKRLTGGVVGGHGGEEEERETNEINDQLIDSNLKKLLKLWIWSENKVDKSVLQL